MPSTDDSPRSASASFDSGSEGDDGRIHRFSLAERIIHRVTAVLMIVCILTAVVLYNGSFSIAIGHRHLIEVIHVYCGFALPVPMVLGAVSVAYRADLHRLGRFSSADSRWLRSRTRRDGTIRVGKFNAGQKLNGALTSSSILVLLATGIIMYFVTLAPLPWRTGATFVHDWFSIAVGLLVIGHITFAMKDPEAREGMRTGWVTRQWARREHAAWLHEMSDGADGGQTREPVDP
ncbi:cytochrome b/b6 domain-containing protein [Allobranchiibius sp. GilTou73]|uniref:cytochrome b/b6 domain-containing protein n=1 Tax=Allobranchiibius sp. GilTou73 TaxID=2904523 RepID=UPI001F361235|nr:cytochrome b/b6 domain-containing protein [Allobranchiibius sp. GilTou73]UIJ35060.1 cytochrome b/b6 domain-containing protein [Allobranchiibius sp. GilTou73]